MEHSLHSKFNLCCTLNPVRSQKSIRSITLRGTTTLSTSKVLRKTCYSPRTWRMFSMNGLFLDSEKTSCPEKCGHGFCPYDCSYIGSPHDMEDRQSYVCERRIVRCPNRDCKEKMDFKKVAEAHVMSCYKLRIYCHYCFPPMAKAAVE